MICDYYAKFQTFLKQKGVQDTVTLTKDNLPVKLQDTVTLTKDNLPVKLIKLQVGQIIYPCYLTN